MKTFITYLNYDHSEFYLWDIHFDREKSIDTFKKVHIPDLIGGRQPDISVLSLLEVDLTEEEVNQLKEYQKTDDSYSFQEFIESVEDSGEYLLVVDGSIGFDLVEYYFSTEHDVEDYEELFDVTEYCEKLDYLEETDPDSYNKLVQEFVNCWIPLWG